MIDLIRRIGGRRFSTSRAALEELQRREARAESALALARAEKLLEGNLARLEEMRALVRASTVPKE